MRRLQVRAQINDAKRKCIKNGGRRRNKGKTE